MRVRMRMMKVKVRVGSCVSCKRIQGLIFVAEQSRSVLVSALLARTTLPTCSDDHRPLSS